MLKFVKNMLFSSNKKLTLSQLWGGVLDRFSYSNLRKNDKFRYIKNGKMLIIFLCIFLM